MNSWFDTFFDKIDNSLQRLARHCPKCGGELNRSFSLLDKIGLFLPLPHTIYAHHSCEQCGARFRSYRNLTDLFLEVSWVAACAYLGEFRLLALACPLTWLIASWILGKQNRFEGDDTVFAGVLTGVLWLLAIVFGGNLRHASLMNHTILFFLLTLCFVLGPIWLVLALDKYTTFGLKDAEE